MGKGDVCEGIIFLLGYDCVCLHFFVVAREDILNFCKKKRNTIVFRCGNPANDDNG